MLSIAAWLTEPTACARNNRGQTKPAYLESRAQSQVAKQQRDPAPHAKRCAGKLMLPSQKVPVAVMTPLAKLCGLSIATALGLAGLAVLVPSRGQAWWRGDVFVGIPPIVFPPFGYPPPVYGPPPVYAAPPLSYGLPPPEYQGGPEAYQSPRAG